MRPDLWKDHPRLRGEKFLLRLALLLMLGSPPLTRGKEVIAVVKVSIKRITPAYAGKSFQQFLEEGGKMDHPRLRGEKALMESFILYITGSPPLTRGKGLFLRRCGSAAGITPAYAGKSKSEKRLESRKRDHPRLRGEKSSGNDSNVPCAGSPPLTRGKVSPVMAYETEEGITPAYAGKSSRPR